MPVFAYYDFRDADTVIDDSALENGAQQGMYMHGAVSDGERLQLNGSSAFGKLYAADMFQAPRGTVSLEFTQAAHVGTGPNTVLSRDSDQDDNGFRLDVMPDGSVQIRHESAGGDVVFTTGPGFVSPGDAVDVSYSWDYGGAEPGRLVIANQTTGATHNDDVPNTVTMTMPNPDVKWLIGTSNAAAPEGELAPLQDYFEGSLGYLSFSDSVDNKGNQDPVANPDVAVTDEDVAITIPVLANDSDPDGDPLTVISADAPNGTVVVNPDGTVTYTPNTDFNGEDIITYTVDDGQGGTATSTVTVTVNPVNDAPVARDDSGNTLMNTPVVINVLANDSDPDGDPLSVYGTPVSADGTVEVLDSGALLFIPNPGFTGEAVITYQVTDPSGLTDSAQVTVTVTPPSTGPRDGIVWGTADGDLIDVNYTGDNDGDFVDNNDAILPGHVNDDDVIMAGDGNDTVYAGDGRDVVFSGNGNDVVYGGAGNDTLVGERGHDFLDGGDGDDLLDGGAGRDTLIGGAGNDTLLGGGGNDLLFGDEGNDLIEGGAGDDTIIGGAGADTLLGGDDRDVFVGATVGDLIDGGSGGNDFDVLDLRGMGPLRVWRDPADPENGHVTFFDAQGNETGRANFFEIEHVIPCFTPGTLVATPRGEIRVEDLRAGDRVITRDNGVQEVRWTGARQLSAAELTLASHLQPVLIRRGALGHGLPERDMLVSPNHRVLVANDRTALYFDEHEVLVAAKHLVGTEGVSRVQSAGTTYIHFMCDRHEVVLSDGAWTETFQPGDQTLKGMGNAQRSEIFELFPELRSETGLQGYEAARKTLKRYEAVLLRR